MSNVIVYSLDAQGGQLAYLMEESHATFPDTPHIANSGAPPAKPTGASIGQSTCVNVRAYRSGVILLAPTDPVATYDLTVYGATRDGAFGTGPLVDDVSGSARLYKIDGLTLTGLSGDQARAITLFDYDWIFVHIENLSSGTIQVDVGYHRFVSEAPEEGA